MALEIKLKSQISRKELLVAIKTSLDFGEIHTWIIDQDGDFTLASDQWENKAWMHLSESKDTQTVDTQTVIFGIIGQKSIPMSKLTYAVYHSCFAQMILIHFDEMIESISISSDKSEADSFC